MTECRRPMKKTEASRVHGHPRRPRRDRQVAVGRDRSAPGFRGDVASLQPDASALDAELCRRVEEVCAPKAIAKRPRKLDRPRQGEVHNVRPVRGSGSRRSSRSEQVRRPVKKRRRPWWRRSRAKHRTALTDSHEEFGRRLPRRSGRLLGRSLAIREVDAGSCNGCEVEVAALNNPVYDIERFGVHFVASPRHADVLLVTGVGSRNMESPSGGHTKRRLTRRWSSPWEPARHRGNLRRHLRHIGRDRQHRARGRLRAGLPA